MKRDKPTRVGDILKRLKKTTPLGEELEQARIWSHWPTLAGKSLCSHGHPKTIKNNILYVEAYSPVWVHKFTYRKWNIIRRINRMAGRELVSDLFVVLAPDADPFPPQDGV